MDVSGSMYRFNGYDGRLEREMEAVCMVMEAFQGYSEKLKVRDLHQRLQYYFTVCLLKPLVLVTHPCHFRLQSHTRVPFFVTVTHLCHFRCRPYTRVTLHYSHTPVSRYVTVTYPWHFMLQYDIYGHSGEDDHVPLTSAASPPADNKQRLQVLQTMHAHSQFCLSGDHTLEATRHAISQVRIQYLFTPMRGRVPFHSGGRKGTSSLW